MSDLCETVERPCKICGFVCTFVVLFAMRDASCSFHELLNGFSEAIVFLDKNKTAITSPPIRHGHNFAC